MDSSRGGQGMSPAGFPHSEICGSRPICGSPQLIAAYHVLHRLLTPRHPPCALSSLTEQLVLDVLPYPSSSIQFSKIAENPRRHGVAPRCECFIGARAISRPPPTPCYLVEILEPTWRLGIGTRRAIRRSRDVEWLD